MQCISREALFDARRGREEHVSMKSLLKNFCLSSIFINLVERDFSDNGFHYLNVSVCVSGIGFAEQSASINYLF